MGEIWLVTWIEQVQIKTPACRTGNTKERAVEFKKQSGFMLMARQFNAILLKNLDFVVTKALGGTSMKESSIFISFDGSADFASFLLELQFFVDSPRKIILTTTKRRRVSI